MESVKMEDVRKFVKKGLELGVGIAYMTVDSLNETVKRLEKEGKISGKEGERIVNDMVRKYRAQSSKYADDMKAQVDILVKSMPFATKKDMERLNARIDQLSKVGAQKIKSAKRKRR